MPDGKAPSTGRWNPADNHTGQTSRTFVFGRSGCGKSTLTRLLYSRPQPGLAVWVVDPLREHPVPVGAGGKRFRLPPGTFVEAGAGYDLADQVGRQALEHGNVLLVVEEAALCHQGRKPPPGLMLCAIEGRHRGVHLLVLSQRPSAVHHDLKAQATDYCVFSLWTPPDVEAVKDLGFDPDAVRGLPVGAYLHCAAGGAPHKHTGAASPCTDKEQDT